MICGEQPGSLDSDPIRVWHRGVYPVSSFNGMVMTAQPSVVLDRVRGGVVHEAVSVAVVSI